VNKTIALIVLLLLVSPATGLAADMFASTGGPVGGLGIVDQTTGLYTFIGDPTTSSALSGIDFDLSGNLFGSENSRNAPSPSTLIMIEPTTGSRLATIGTTKDASGVGIKITDLAFQPGTGTLFAFTNQGILYTVNTTTAVATRVGDSGLALKGGGLAFTSTGDLFVASVKSRLSKLNPTTGAVIGSKTNLSKCFDGLVARPGDDVLFGTECDSQSIYTINPVDGTVSLIGDSGTSTSDLAFVRAPTQRPSVPTLSAWGLVVLILVLITTGAYRRPKIWQC